MSMARSSLRSDQTDRLALSRYTKVVHSERSIRDADCLLRLTASRTSATQHHTMPRAQDPTQSLLRWGIEHAAPGSLAQTAQEIKDGKRPDLDTGILKAMMGQTDAEKMRECVMVIEGQWVHRDGTGEVKNNADITPEDRYRAWEDLEMVSPSVPLTRARQCL